MKSPCGKIAAKYEFLLWTVFLLLYSPCFHELMWPLTVHDVELHGKTFLTFILLHVYFCDTLS